MQASKGRGSGIPRSNRGDLSLTCSLFRGYSEGLHFYAIPGGQGDIFRARVVVRGAEGRRGAEAQEEAITGLHAGFSAQPSSTLKKAGRGQQVLIEMIRGTWSET